MPRRAGERGQVHGQRCGCLGLGTGVGLGRGGAEASALHGVRMGHGDYTRRVSLKARARSLGASQVRATCMRARAEAPYRHRLRPWHVGYRHF